MRWFQIGLLMLVACLFATASSLGQTDDTGQAEQSQNSHAKQDQVPKQKIYDPAADASQEIAAALKRAKAENRRVLIQWGGDWCPSCQALHRMMKTDRELGRKLQYEYDVVYVDVGRRDNNQTLWKKYGVDLDQNEIPFATVLTADGQLVANQDVLALGIDEDGKKSLQQSAILKFLTDHEALPNDAKKVVTAGIDQAKSDGKLVLLHFGAPWCGWCHRMEDWMARPEVHRVLAPVFVDVKVDLDRMTNAESVYEFYCKEQGGIPWFVFLTEDGEAIVDSTVSAGNLGFPYTEDEIAEFIKMLQQTDRFELQQLKFMAQSLTENRKRLESKSGRK